MKCTEESECDPPPKKKEKEKLVSVNRSDRGPKARIVLVNCCSLQPRIATRALCCNVPRQPKRWNLGDLKKRWFFLQTNLKPQPKKKEKKSETNSYSLSWPKLGPRAALYCWITPRLYKSERVLFSFRTFSPSNSSVFIGSSSDRMLCEPRRRVLHDDRVTEKREQEEDQCCHPPSSSSGNTRPRPKSGRRRWVVSACEWQTPA